MEEQLIEEKQEEPAAKKKVYMKPEITIYGKLVELTAGGTQSTNEAKYTDDPPQYLKRLP